MRADKIGITVEIGSFIIRLGWNEIQFAIKGAIGKM